MKRFIFILSLLTLTTSYSIFAQETESAGSASEDAFAIIPNLEAEEKKDVDLSRTKATFKTNVKTCKIFLNGNFQGLSKLTLTNLIEGYYLLRVEKNGYITRENFVYIERAKDQTFYVELEPNEETKKKLEKQNKPQETNPAENAEPQAEKPSEGVDTVGESK